MRSQPVVVKIAAGSINISIIHLQYTAIAAVPAADAGASAGRRCNNLTAVDSNRTSSASFPHIICRTSTANPGAIQAVGDNSSIVNGNRTAVTPITTADAGASAIAFCHNLTTIDNNRATLVIAL